MIFISAIILAAGKSTRMGKSKLLMDWNGKTILEQTIDNYLGSAVNEVVIVLGHESYELQKFIGERDVITVINPQYTKGMSTSIVTGMNFLSVQTQGVILALADQPTVGSNTINNLIDAFKTREKGIIIPVYYERRGNPVMFDIKYRKELLELTGDSGAREVVERHPEDVAEIFAEEEVMEDIDTEKDYTALKNRLKRAD